MFLDEHNGLRVTDVQVRLASTDDDRFLGFASFTLNHALAVGGLRIIRSPITGRIFVAFPDRFSPASGHKRDVLFPIDARARLWIERIVLRAFEAELRSLATDREYAEALDGGLAASSCGHPAEDVAFEMQASEAA